MNNQRPPSSGKAWPDDLRAWVAEPTLVRLTFDAVHTFEHDATGEGTRETLASGNPRVFLTLLTYAYAVGLLDADEIQRQVRVDPQIGYLAARTSPTALQLRQFRRQHRDWVEGTLRALFQLVWEFRAGPDAEWSYAPGDNHRLFELAAQDRIDRALLADSMALDT